MKKILTLVLSLGLLCPVYASLYDQAWEAIGSNDFQKAEQLFRPSVDEEPQKAADALVSMYLMYEMLDQNDKAFDCFQRYYQLDKDATYTMLVLFHDGALSAEQGDKQLNFLLSAAQTKHPVGTLNSELAEALTHYYWRHKNKGKFKTWHSAIEIIDKWQVLGIFDNTSASGFDRNVGAVEHPEETAEFENKVGYKVRWYEADYINKRGWFDFEEVFGTNGIVYAQSFVTSPKDCDVILSVGTSGSLKVWVNDGLVMSEAEERNCGDDTYLTRVHLNAGTNRVLLQLGSSEISHLNFKLRFTDEQLHPIHFNSSAKYSSYRKATSDGSLQFIERPQEAWFRERMKRDSSALNTLLLAQAYLYADKNYEALELLEELEKRYPVSTLVAYYLLDGYNRSNNNTDCSRVREGVRHNDPDGYFGTFLRYKEAYDADNYLEAERLINEFEQKFGKSTQTYLEKLKVMAALNKDKESRELVKEAYSKYPTNKDVLGAYYVINRSSMSNPESILENYLKKIEDESLISNLIDIYNEKSQSYKAYKWAKYLVSQYPDDIDYLRELVVSNYRLNSYESAIKLCREGIRRAPYVSWFHSTLGYLYVSYPSNSPIPSLETSIKLNPNNYDARMNLRYLREQKEIFGELPYSIDSLIANAPRTSESKEVVLLRDRVYVFYPEGASEMRTHLLVKVMNQSGVEDMNEMNLSNSEYAYRIVDTAELIKANGQRIKATQNNGSVVFTNLEAGDCVYVVFRTRYYYPRWQAKCIDEQFAFQNDEDPVLISRVTLMVPQGMPVNYTERNITLSPVKSTNDEGQDVYVWEARDIPRINVEENTLWADNLPSLYLSSIASWRDIQDWYADITKNKLKSDYIVRNTLQSILEGKENASEYEKTKAIYEYVAGQITYSNASFLHGACIPQRASSTIVTRLGDCKDVSTLFVTLCREAGIKADLVLVSTRKFGIKCMPLPSRNFNHCITRVWLDGKMYYLELTDNYLPFTAIPEQDYHALYLPIDDSQVDRLSLIETSNGIMYATKRYLQVAFAGQALKMHYKIEMIGENAASQRGAYLNQSDEYRQKEVSEGIASWYDGVTKVENIQFEHLDDMEPMVVRDQDVTVENYVQQVADMQLFKLPWIVRLQNTNLVASETRKYELNMWASLYRDNYTQMTVQLPAGKNFVEMPKSVVYRCNGAEYRVKVEKLSQNRVRLTRTMTCNKDFLAPSDFPEFRKFYTDIMNYEAKQYIIK
ncbi:MAG: DUF3857 domain-containing protein [Paludibacteraceae bacterium]|nr:DUF3857 domain-containing protein [Paludibacteraceae bacterium]